MVFDQALSGAISGLTLYGITPPRLSLGEDQLTELSRKREARLKGLGPDALIVYDLQDESQRTQAPRPFPFSPTMSAVDYSQAWLEGRGHTILAYLPVSRYDEEGLEAELRRLESRLPSCKAVVFVGASSSQQRPSLPLNRAYEIFQSRPRRLLLGAVSIPERHRSKGDEHLRCLAKSRQGCSFFVSQCVYDLECLKDFLSEYRWECAAQGLAPAYFIFTLSPAGSIKSLEFMRWLGISVPRWLERDMGASGDALAESMAHCHRLAQSIADYSGGAGIPFGFNVESLSSRALEIAASQELFLSLRGSLSR